MPTWYYFFLLGNTMTTEQMRKQVGEATQAMQSGDLGYTSGSFCIYKTVGY